MTNGDVTRIAQPFASIHQNSGVFYSPFGTSGVMRYTAGKEFPTALSADITGIFKGFEISVDGGQKYLLKIGSTQGTGSLIPVGAAIIEALMESQLRLLGSGIKVDSGRQLALGAWNSSGRLEYRFGPHQTWHVKNTHASTGGPANDGYWPIPHSGNVGQMIAQKGFSSVSGVTVLGGVPVSEGTSEDGILQPYASIHLMSGIFHSSYGASGILRFEDKAFGLSMNDGETFNLLLQENLFSNYGATIQAPTGQLRLIGNSGVRLEATDLNVIIHAVDGNITLDATGLGTAVLSIFSDDYMLIDAEGALDITGDDISIVGDAGFVLNSFNTQQFFSQENFNVTAFSNSGQLTYGFGPHQSWYIKTSHSSTGGPNNDGYWPIAHSGNVAQMIADRSVSIGSGLQNAYNTRRLIVLTSNPGNLQLISNTAKTEFSTFGTRAELNISGLYIPPTLANLESGDLYMMNHGVISGIVGTQKNTNAQAQALGIGSLVLQTGSGIINVSVGSGIAMFGNSTLMQITQVLQTIPLNSTLEAADMNYSIGTGANSGVVTVYSPGLYKISYKVTNDKTVGTTAQECTVRLEYNNDGNAIFGSVINTIHINNTTASANTSSTVLILNMNAGDNVRMKINSSADGLQNCNVIARGATIVIEKIGPQRGVAGS